MNKYTYDYDGFSFTLTIPEYWEKVYAGKPRENLYGDYAMLLRIVKKVDKSKFILDVGANHGIFAVPAAMLGYEVIAFEPVMENFKTLNYARADNGLSGLYLFNMALGNVNGSRDIYIPECTDNSSFSPAAAVANMANKNFSVENVPMIRFDDWIKDHGHFKNIGFIKVDAQGAEYEIIEGMKGFLTQASDIYIACEYENHLNTMGHTFQQLDELFAALGFADLGNITGGDKLFFKK